MGANATQPSPTAPTQLSPGLAAAAPPERGQVDLLLLLHTLQGRRAAVGAAGAAGAGQAAIPTTDPHRSLLHLGQQLGGEAAQGGHRRVRRPALCLQVVVAGRALQNSRGGEAAGTEDPSPLRVAGGFSERHCKRGRKGALGIGCAGRSRAVSGAALGWEARGSGGVTAPRGAQEKE